MSTEDLYFQIESFRVFVRLLVRLVLLTPALLTPVLLTPWPALAENSGLCSSAEVLVLNTTIRGVGMGRSCYRIDLPSPGVLTLDTSAPGTPRVEPQLVFWGSSSKNVWKIGRYRLVRETPRGVVVEVMAPGSFFLVVASEDPTEPLDGYKLRSAFVSRGDGFGGTFAPSAYGSCPVGSSSQVVTKDVDEVDCDPWEDLRVIPGAYGPDVFGLCQIEIDDHGDVPLCATPIALGDSAVGRLENAAGDDEDFFTFVVDEMQSVRIEAETGHLTLYDSKGQRLATSGDGDQGARIVRTLSPGRYDVRLLGLWGSVDDYVLRLEIPDEM